MLVVALGCVWFLGKRLVNMVCKGAGARGFGV
jgi:hypothetical protein